MEREILAFGRSSSGIRCSGDVSRFKIYAIDRIVIMGFAMISFDDFF